MDNHNQIYFDSTVSAESLDFQPFGAPTSFFVTVTNKSSQHAQFELQLFPEGINEKEAQHLWYIKTPVSSRKMPPGAQVQFKVQIKDNPIPEATTIRFFVKVYSPQLPGFQRHRLRLIILPQLPLALELTPNYYRYLPGQNLKIALRLSNPFPSTINVRLRVTDFPFDLTEYLKPILDVKLEAKTTREIFFKGKLKKCAQTLAKQYPFTIEAYLSQRKSGVSQGTLEIVKFGNLKFIKLNEQFFPPKKSWLQCWLPEQNSWLPKKDKLPIIYQLQLKNTSNCQPAIPQEIDLDVHANDTKGNPIDSFTIDLKYDSENRQLKPDQTINAELKFNQKRHWWGKNRKLQLQLFATTTDVDSTDYPPNDLGVARKGDRKAVDVYVRPFLPLWLQIVVILGFLGALGLFLWSLIYQPHHTQAVNTVTFRRGSSNPEVYSGSADKTVRQWEVNQNHPFCRFFRWQQYCLKSKGVLLDDDQSIIALNFQSEDNNVLAIVPESDRVLYWDFTKGGEIDITHQGAPQILDLVFTKDSQNLFTINDDNVCRWEQTYDQGYRQQNCVLTKQEQFPISSFTLNRDDQWLIFGGRANKVYRWNWEEQSLAQNYFLLQDTCPKKRCTTNDNIKSLDINDNNILATADSEGYISLYNLNFCTLAPNGQEINCPQTEQWQILSDSESQSPVIIDTIALTTDGRFLVVADQDPSKDGKNSKIRLWELNKNGRLDLDDDLEDYNQGTIIGEYNSPINSIDLIYAGNQEELLMVTGSEDHQVRLIIHKLTDN